MRFFKSNLGYLGILVTLAFAVFSIPASSPEQGSMSNRSFKHDGIERSFLLYRGDSALESEKRPVIIALHGGGGTPRNFMRITEGGFNKLADHEGYLIVYPEGVKKYWNEGRKKPLSYSHRNDVDDVGFIEALIESLKTEFSIDESRIFLTGRANGGLMAFRLACEMPGTFRAIAVVNASLPNDVLPACDLKTDTSVLLMNGTKDPIMPYQGGTIRDKRGNLGEVLSTKETIMHWLEINGCPAHAKKKILTDLDPRDRTTITTYNYAGCPDNLQVLLYEIRGGGHTWPGGRQFLKKAELVKRPMI